MTDGTDEGGPHAGRPSALSSRSRRLLLVVILAGLTAIGPIGMDVYLPGLPQLAADFDTTQAAVQVTLTLNVVGLVVGQLLLSPLTDQRGRRGTLLGSILLVWLTCAAAMFAPTLMALAWLRLLQGIGSGACIAIARAIASDVAKGTAAARLFTWFITISAVGPMVAPLIGAGLLEWTGTWRSSFAFLTAFGAILLLAVWRCVPETLAPADRHPGGLRQIASAFRQLIGDRVFVGYAGTVVFAYSAMFAYLAASSFVIEVQFERSPAFYAAVFAANSVGLMGAGMLNARMVRTVPPRRMLIIALVVATLAGALMLVVAVLDIPLLPALLVALFCVVASRGIITPNAMVLGVQRSPAAGAASAILGACMFAGGVLVTPFVGTTPSRPSVAMSVTIAIGTALALACTLLLTRSRRAVAGAEA